MNSFLGSTLHGALALLLGSIITLMGLVIWSIERHNSPRLTYTFRVNGFQPANCG